jgi:hypothetical protein
MIESGLMRRASSSHMQTISWPRWSDVGVNGVVQRVEARWRGDEWSPQSMRSKSLEHSLRMGMT